MKLIKSVKSGQLATIKAQWYELTHKKAYFVFCSTVLGREKMRVDVENQVACSFIQAAAGELPMPTQRRDGVIPVAWAARGLA